MCNWVDTEMPEFIYSTWIDSNELGLVAWLGTSHLKNYAVSWRNHTENLTRLDAQNMSFWLKIYILSSYFTIWMPNCLKKTSTLMIDSSLAAAKFLT